MATTAISSADVTTLRNSVHNIDDVSLYVTPLSQVAEATITAVPATQPFVDLDVTWNSGQSAVRTGQLVVITDSNNDVVSRAVVRKEPDLTSLFISATPLGSAGYATLEEVSIAVDHTATVYNHRPLWGLYSRIDETAKVFYKEWDKAYTDENSQPPPVANTGTWQAAKVASGSTARFTLPRSGTNDSFALGAATISSYSWSLPSGVSIVSGYTTSDSVIEVDADAGTHQVSLTVTDSNSKTHTAYMWLFVSDSDTEKALSETYPVIIESDSQDRRGRELTFTVNVLAWDGSVSELYPGAGVMLKFDTSFDGGSLTDSVIVDTFIGYITDIASNHDSNAGTVTVTAKSPVMIADDIPVPEQALEEVSSPSRWTECTSALSNLRGAAYYLMKWHAPAFLDMHDLPSDIDSTLRRQYINLDTQSLGAGLTKVTSLFLPEGNAGSLSDGTTVIKPHLSLEDNTTRNNAEVIMTVTENDIRPPLTIIRRFYDGIREVRGGAFSYDGTDLTGKYAQKKWYQGTASITVPDFTAPSGSEVARTIEVIGHAAALKNASIQDIGFDFVGYRDVVEPAAMQWLAINISAEYVPYSSIPANWRTIPLSVDREWAFNPEAGIDMQTTVFVQPETFGQLAEEYTVPNVVDDNLTGFDGQPFVPYYDANYELAGGVGTLATDGLTQAQLEESLLKYALSVVLKTDLDSTGTETTTVGDAVFEDADEDGFDDETGLSQDEFTGASKLGGEYGVVEGFFNSIQKAIGYNNSQSPTTAEMEEYLNSLYDTNATDVTTFAAELITTGTALITNPDTIANAHPISGEIAFVENMRLTNFKGAFSQETYEHTGSMTDAELALFRTAVSMFTTSQYQEWYDLGATKPRTNEEQMKWYIYPIDEFVYNSGTEGTIATTGFGAIGNQIYVNRPNQLFSLNVSGTLTNTNGDFRDPFYRRTGTNPDTWTWQPFQIGFASGTANLTAFIPEQSEVPFNPGHTYTWSIKADMINGAAYCIRAPNYGIDTGEISLSIKHLGGEVGE